MFVIDESSYRTDKTSFPTAEEAQQRAAEAARIVNRPINVYQMQEGALNFAFRVMPCGDVEYDQPTVEPETGDQIEQEYPVLGEVVKELDSITEALEAKGATELASRVDRVVHKLTSNRVSPGVRSLVKRMKATAARGTYDVKAKMPNGEWVDANQKEVPGAKEYAVFNPSGVPFLKGFKKWREALTKAQQFRRMGGGLPFA